MLEKDKIKVLLITEGTYPYNGGGVSTWAHILCSKVANASYSLYAINAAFESAPKYVLPETVKEVIQVPLWTPDEPIDYINYGDEYYKIVAKKESASEFKIKRDFIPVFKKLLYFIYGDQKNLDDLDYVFYEMWLYFEDYDFKKTMQSEAVWFTYVTIINTFIDGKKNSEAKLIDLTVGMRWLYRFLIPIAIADIPKVDVAHITLSGFPLLPALIAHYKHGTAIVLTEHGVFIRERLLAINNAAYPFFLKNLLIRFSEAIARLAYYKSEKIISVNRFNNKWELLYGADPKKIAVIYNGIDHELFCPREKPAHLKNIPTVVALARIFELKDILTMIRSCEVVKKKIPNVQYLVYGDDSAVPEYTHECIALIKELQLEDNFKLMGQKNNSHLLFCEGDISILTSISEGFPYTVLESMSCGIPVVATDVGGVKEGLDDASGFLCKPKDAAFIGKKVIELLENKELRNAMSKHARQRVLENFTLDKFIKAYENVYEEAALINVDACSFFADKNYIKA